MTENLKELPVGQQVIADALEAIRNRSFSGRHPELGKMINCPHCDLRHRENERKCEQRFATGRYDLRDPKPLLIAGQTPETSSLKGVTARSVLGAAFFSRRRIRPHSNRRKRALENRIAAKQREKHGNTTSTAE